MAVDVHCVTTNQLLVLPPFEYPRSREANYSPLGRWVAFEDDRLAVRDPKGEIGLPKSIVECLESVEVFQRGILTAEFSFGKNR
jgi:hypothetical protein